MTVPDASVVVKWYVPERDHEPARSLRDAYLNGSHDLAAPALLPFEVVNALRYSGHYDDERLAEAAETLPQYGIDLVGFDDCGPVAAVATALDVTVYDAAYVALAARSDERFYTADEAVLAAVRHSEYDDRVAHVRAFTGD